MDIRLGDTVVMKKQHPCGCKNFKIMRVGVDFVLKCEKCGHEVVITRIKAEKNIKEVKRTEEI